MENIHQYTPSRWHAPTCNNQHHNLQMVVVVVVTVVVVVVVYIAYQWTWLD